MIDWSSIPANVFHILDNDIVVLKVGDVVRPDKVVNNIISVGDKLTVNGYINRNKFTAYEIVRLKKSIGHVIGYNYVYFPFNEKISDFRAIGFVQTLVVFADINENVFILNKTFKNVEDMRYDYEKRRIRIRQDKKK